MINHTYLANDRVIDEMPIKMIEDIWAWFTYELRRGFYNRRKNYAVVLGYPMGMGALKTDEETQYPMYQIYGIAAQDNELLLGRRLPDSKPYEVTVKNYLQKFKDGKQFMVSDELFQKSVDLLANQPKDLIESINTIIVDDQKELVILTSVAPSVMTEQNLVEVAQKKVNE